MTIKQLFISNIILKIYFLTFSELQEGMKKRDGLGIFSFLYRYAIRKKNTLFPS